MASETIVAVFDTAAHAEAAINDLTAHGIPAGSIEHYAQNAGTTGAETTGADTGAHRGGLWGWLTGETEVTTQHNALYDQTIQSGGTVVTVISETANVDTIYGILEKHGPIDLDERHSQYSESGAYGAFAGATAAPSAPVAAKAATSSSNEEVLSLSEETLAVGKREVDHGTTRVRRYVVERPVEEQIKLRNETVSVFRRPVTGATVGADAFTDRVIVMNETDEEAMVAKSAHVVEEVVLQKSVEERVETVRDTLRREEVEIIAPKTTETVTSPTTKVGSATAAGTTKPLAGI